VLGLCTYEGLGCTFLAGWLYPAVYLCPSVCPSIRPTVISGGLAVPGSVPRNQLAAGGVGDAACTGWVDTG
jgi:hypothetical protein